MQLVPFELNILNGAMSEAFADTRPAMYVVINNSMQVDIGPDEFQQVPKGASVSDLAPVGPWLCLIDGQYISRDDWWQPIRSGECVIFHQRPQGKDGLRAILMIAVIFASVFMPAFLSLGAGTWQAALAGAAINLVGNLLVNALIPMERPESASSQISNNYNVALQGNAARLDQAIPVLYGHNKTYPDFAAQPYTINDNVTSDSYYHFCLCIGQGQYQVLRVSIDDTPLSNFADVQYKIIGPGQADGETLAIVDSSPAINVIDSCLSLSGWATTTNNGQSVVSLDTVGGNPANSFKLQWQNNGSIPCAMQKDFGVAGYSGVKFSSDFQLTRVGGKYRAGWGVARNAPGVGVMVAVDYDLVNGPLLTIGKAGDWGSYGSVLSRDAMALLSPAVWYRMEITVYKLTPSTVTVTAVVKSGATVLHSLTCPSIPTAIGGYCGFFGVVYEDLGALSTASFDNLVVQNIPGQSFVKTNIVNAPEVAGQDLLTGKTVGPFIATGSQYACISIGIDIALPRGLSAGKSVNWNVFARQVNDFEQPINAWVKIADETYNVTKATPIRLSFNYSVPAGRYQVQLKRIDVRDASSDVAHDLSWLGLRAELLDPGISSNTCTYVVGRIRASEQLSGLSQRRISVLSNRMLPVWDGTAWSSNVVTRNAAWAMTDVLRNQVYGRKLADSKIDLATMLTLANTWDVRQDRFDMTMDGEITTWDALTIILRGSRAVPLIRGSRYTAVRDSQQSLPVAMYGMRNIKADSFSLSYAMPEEDQVDALDFEYWDYRAWDWRVMTAQVYLNTMYAYRGDANRPLTVPEPLNRVKTRLSGVIGENQVKREVIYHLADSHWRRRRARYTTELDGLLPAYGSLVLVSHDVPGWGQSGDVFDYNASTLTVSTTEPLNWTTGTHFIRLQKPDGSVTTPIVVTKGLTDYDAILAVAPGFTLITYDAGRERPRYIFGPSESYGSACRLKSLKPMNNYEVEHVAVLEDDRVHAADTPWLAGVDIQDAISDGKTIEILSAISPTVGLGTTYVTLTNQDVFAYSNTISNTTPPTASFSLLATGRAYGIITLGTNSNIQDMGLQWLSAQPVTTEFSSKYEVNVTLTSGGAFSNTPLTSGTIGAWENLGVDRTWQLNGSSGTASSGNACALQVSIREVASGVVQSSAMIRLFAHNQEPSGGL